MRYLLVVGLGLAAAAVLLALQNPVLVSVRLFAGSLVLPLSLLLIVVLVLGAAIGILCLLPSLLRATSSAQRQRYQLRELQQQLDQGYELQTVQDKRIRYLEAHLKTQNLGGDRPPD
ncbi:MAG: DUF1049 domain-containing protein [Spirulinaceae cyanobacterium SM2_1_0]|nr:DUF1049 domain-containing protein [Spirulinaceae cyanobacterium SM2_1_0]